MARPIVNGTFFERVQILINNDIALDSSGLFRVEVDGSEMASRVNAFSPNHKISGVVRGNGEYEAILDQYIRYNVAAFDWRGIDYDLQNVSVALLYPSANYGVDDVFVNSSQYLLLSNVYLDGESPLKATGVGSPVSSTTRLIVTDYQILLRS